MPPNSLKSQYPESIKVMIGISPSESSSSKRAKASPPSPLAHDHHILCSDKCATALPSSSAVSADTSPNTVVPPVPSDCTTIFIVTRCRFVVGLLVLLLCLPCSLLNQERVGPKPHIS